MRSFKETPKGYKKDPRCLERLQKNWIYCCCRQWFCCFRECWTLKRENWQYVGGWSKKVIEDIEWSVQKSNECWKKRKKSKHCKKDSVMKRMNKNATMCSFYRCQKFRIAVLKVALDRCYIQLCLFFDIYIEAIVFIWNAAALGCWKRVDFEAGKWIGLRNVVVECAYLSVKNHLDDGFQRMADCMGESITWSSMAGGWGEIKRGDRRPNVFGRLFSRYNFVWEPAYSIIERWFPKWNVFGNRLPVVSKLEQFHKPASMKQYTLVHKIWWNRKPASRKYCRLVSKQ